MNDTPYYEIEDNFRKVVQTAVSLMDCRQMAVESEILSKSQISIVNTDFDKWNGGTYGYTIYVDLSTKEYAKYTPEEISQLEDRMSQCFNEVIKDDNNSGFAVIIKPVVTTNDINWSAIDINRGKELFYEKLESMKSMMISVATGGPKINDVDDNYKAIFNALKLDCQKLHVNFNFKYPSLWDWYSKWSADLPTYKERRIYVNEYLSDLYDLSTIENETPELELMVNLSDWDKITRNISKIKKECSIATKEEDFQQIGLLCRELIISIAQQVYNPQFHETKDTLGIEISNTDGVRMLEAYFSYVLAGSKNEFLRSYAKSTNKLANQLTHKRDSNKQDMRLTVSATIALINMIGILENKL